MPKTAENFYIRVGVKLMAYALKCPQNNHFTTYLMELKLRKECKEDYMEIRKSQVGIRLQDN